MHAGYDPVGAVGSPWGSNIGSSSRYFCSELAVAALQAGGLLAGTNESGTTPADMLRLHIWAETYFQLVGPDELVPFRHYRDHCSHNPEGDGDA